MEEALKAQHKYVKVWKELKKKSIVNGCTNDEANTIAYGSLEYLNKDRQMKSDKAIDYSVECFSNKNWDGLIDFLTIDAPAFRVGYKKEYFLRKMKNIILNEKQKQVIKEFIFTLLQLDGYRRELKDFAKLSYTWFSETEMEDIYKLKESATNLLHQQKIIYFSSWLKDFRARD